MREQAKSPPFFFFFVAVFFFFVRFDDATDVVSASQALYVGSSYFVAEPYQIA
jgi:hypothetical protein